MTVPRWLAMIMLVTSPVMLTTVVVGSLMFVASFRKGFGAFTTIRPEAVLIAAGFWALHLGFILAPFLYMHERKSLAMWLTIPLAVLASLMIAFFVMQESGHPRNVASGVANLLMNAMMFGGVVVYWLPVAALMTGR